MMTRFIQWIGTRWKYMYWYTEPARFWGVEAWGKTTTIPGSTIRIKTVGNKVSKKKCKKCGVEVWSNNEVNVCGRLKCWLKGV